MKFAPLGQSLDEAAPSDRRFLDVYKRQDNAHGWGVHEHIWNDPDGPQ
ncbi:hypothetical protein [Plesiocystis pacifica]|nr:hypothetical protein [Plesiocystis pacifica]